ncbi:hypothetical protein VNO77_31253 [Canavalia gladiata]|uniref:Uncharacterized protein n=1 Tax=Canavalia gladiata TaxID=3824 RepID=A0AAN9Q4K0_CANGL
MDLIHQYAVLFRFRAKDERSRVVFLLIPTSSSWRLACLVDGSSVCFCTNGCTSPPSFCYPPAFRLHGCSSVCSVLCGIRVDTRFSGRPKASSAPNPQLRPSDRISCSRPSL